MSKYLALVLVPMIAPDCVEQVGKRLLPYRDDGEPGNRIAKLDYWLIGGLHVGVLTGGPSRIETLNWTHPSYLLPVAEWEEQIGTSTVVAPGGRSHDLEERTRAGYVRKHGYLQRLLDRHRDCGAITLMCHA
jgi:hypothetical protein